ncbi:MAG: Gfo/Idh/MocA family protein [Capsulimonadaceae bacterium]
MPYKVAIVGGGHMGIIHARHWMGHEVASVVGVLDPRGDAVRLPGDPPVYTDWDALLAATAPDIIDICTPTAHHRGYVERAAAAGRAIFCEKPLARTMADCDAIVDAVERSGVPFMAGHVVRWFPAFARAKSLVDSGGVGRPVAIRASRVGSFPGAGRPDNWYADPEQSGGVILDLSLHEFDWMRWCLGEVDRVYARSFAGRPDLAGKLDYALVTLRFRSGVVGHVTGSWAHSPGIRVQFEIAGDAGLIEHDSSRSVSVTVAQRPAASEPPSAMRAAPRAPLAPADDPYRGELGAFLAALAAGVDPPVTVYDSRAAVRIALAAIESVLSGKAVTLL